MTFFKPGLISTFCAAALLSPLPLAKADSAPTNLVVIVRHAPSLNGGGRIEGSLQQLLGEGATLNGAFVMTGDFLAPGTPTPLLNGTPSFYGVQAGTGSLSPSGYRITLNGNCALRYLRTRTDPATLPAVAAPPSPKGTRNVTINTAGQSIGAAATLHNLTLNGNVGQVAVPPGSYGAFTANGASGFTLGTAGSTEPAGYNLQSLTLNGSARIDVTGPIILTVANGISANGIVGTTNRSDWLQLRIASGGLTLNGGCFVHGEVLAPSGTLIVNGNSCLAGSAQCDRLIVNGGGLIKSGQVPNQPPVAVSRNLRTPEDTPLNFALSGTDPEGSALSCILLDPPSHGRLESPDAGTLHPGQGVPITNGLVYTPGTNYNGTDGFSFKVNDGQLDSAPATVTIAITPVNDPPVAEAQFAVTDENAAIQITLIGSDVDGDQLQFAPTTQPAR